MKDNIRKTTPPSAAGRRTTRGGYVLNFRVAKPPMLHRSLCPHIENFSDPRASLTATAKFCSTDRATLTGAIRDLSMDYERCSHNHCFG
jgi:hypothetical protein